MKRVISIVLCIFFLTLLPGCWNRKELNSLAVLQAVGIDKTEDGQIRLSAQILLPSAVRTGKSDTSGGNKGVWVVTAEGETVFDAFRNSTLISSRKLFLSHNKVIVISETLAKEGLGDVMDLFNRDHEFRKLPYVFVTKGKAEEIISGEHEQEKITAKALESLAKTTFATSKIAKVRVFDLDKNLVSKTNDPIIPGIEIVQVKKEKQIKDIVKLDGTAIFKSDKLVSWLDGRETRGALWVLNEVKSGIIVVSAPEGETKKVSIEIMKASSRIVPKIEEGTLKVNVNIQAEGNLAEQMSEANLAKMDTLSKLETKMSSAISDEIQAAIVKAQKWDTDIFKFGEDFHRKFPKEWPELEKNWDQEFEKIEVSVFVDAKLRRTGVLSNPIMYNRVKGEESE